MSTKTKIMIAAKSIFPTNKISKNLFIPTTQPTSRQNTFQKTVISWTKRITHSSTSGDINKAIHLFVKMPHRNQASWNAILTALLHSNRLDFARKMFEKMPYKNSVSYTAMISGLSRVGSVLEARQVFDSGKTSPGCNVISWTAMISCYSKNGLHFEGLKLFVDCYSDFFAGYVFPNPYTFSTVLKCCLELASLEIAVQIHGLIVKLLNEDDESCVYVHNGLIDLYSKLGNLVDVEKIFNGMKWKDLSSWNIILSAYVYRLMMDKAVQIFNSVQEKDTLSWNILMSGWVESGHEIEALKSFIGLWNLSIQDDTRPNPSTFTIILTVCGTFCLLKWGTSVHTCTIKCGFYGDNIYIGNAMINMYAKLGCIEESERVFNEMPKRDIISWNSLALGLGQNGYCKRTIEVAEKALKLGFCDHNTFIGVLTSCSHGGLVNEGLHYFNSMTEKYGIEQSLDHYICVIDMLGRAGKIDEACNFLHRMPFEPNALSWETLLSACVVHNNEKVGKLASEKLKGLDPTNVKSYVMLANLYGRSGKSEAYKNVICSMDDVGLRKEQCRSFIL